MAYNNDTDLITLNASNLSDATQLIKEPNGFNTAIYDEGMQDVLDMSFDSGTEEFTIAPKDPYTEYDYYYRGEKVTVSTSKSVSCPFATSRSWYIWFNDETATLEAVSTLPNGAYSVIRDNVYVASIIWNIAGTDIVISGFEAHGLMPWEIHMYNHFTTGARYQNGIQPSPIDNTTNIAFTEGTIWDEDIPFVTSVISNSETIMTMFRDGDTWDGSKIFAGVKTSGGAPVYNYDSGGNNWVTDVVGATKYVCVHYYATNDFNGNSIFAVAGHVEYDKATDARAGAESELATISLLALPSAEFKAIATCIIDSAASSWTFEPVGNDSMFIDWRQTNVGVATEVEVGTTPTLYQVLLASPDGGGITVTNIGEGDAQWNADELQGYSVSAVAPSDGEVLVYDTGNSVWTPQASSAGTTYQSTYKPNADGSDTAWSSNTNYEYTVTVTGASVGDAIIVNVDSAIYLSAKTAGTSVDIFGYVSATDTVVIDVRVVAYIELATNDTIRITVIGI